MKRRLKVFKTSWKQIDEDRPIIYVKYEDVKLIIDKNTSKEDMLKALDTLDIFSDRPIGKHRTPSYGSD